MRRSVFIAFGFVALLATPAFAQDVQPSFDCAKAATTVENAICSDATLAGLDAELATRYTDALAKAVDVDAARAAQRDWAAQRGPACNLLPGADDEAVEPTDAGINCLVDLYRDRLSQLTEAQAAPVGGDQARLLDGLWQIAEVIEAQDPAMTKDDQKGRLIRLNRHSLSSLGGAGCAGPTLQPLAEARARPLDADEQALIGKADAVQPDEKNGIAGFCLGRLFALYVPAADGSLLVADASALYRLQRLSNGTP